MVPRSILQLYTFASTSDDRREALQSVRVTVDTDGAICGVATDGHRLTMIIVKQVDDCVLPNGVSEVLIPASVCKKALRAASAGSTWDLNGQTIVRNDGVSVSFSGGPDSYPDVSRFILSRPDSIADCAFNVDASYVGDIGTYLKKCKYLSITGQPIVRVQSVDPIRFDASGSAFDCVSWTLIAIVMPFSK